MSASGPHLGAPSRLTARPGTRKDACSWKRLVPPDRTGPAGHDISDVFFVGAEVSAIVLTLATGLVALRTGALPRLFGWLSVLLAVWLAIGPIGWAGLLLGFPLWVVAAAVLLVSPPRAGSPAADEPLAPLGG
jgi:hypothetical protein